MPSSTLPPEFGEILLSWQAPEHDPLELGPRSRIIVTTLLIGIIGYALFTDSALMAITFILVGVVGYLTSSRDPKTLAFHVTTHGIIAGTDFYDFETIESFHFYAEPPFEGLLSLKTNGKLVPYVHIPIMTVDAGALRDLLVQVVPEDTHEPGLVDTLEKLLHI